MTTPRRVELEPAFLLHHYPWRDTSRILELLTRTHGRVSVIARASRKTSAAVGSVLQPFNAALVSWTSRGELGYLNGAERPTSPAFSGSPMPAGEVGGRPDEGSSTSPTSVGEVAQRAGEVSSPLPRTGKGPLIANRYPLTAPPALAGDRLMSGFYANELLLKLLQRNDPHPTLFDAYATLVARLQTPAEDPGRALRLFEKRLLDELGWGLDLAHEASTGAPIDPARTYRYRLEGGAEPIDGVAEGTLIFCGASLLSLARESLDDPRSLADARRLLRAALDRLLEGRPLRTREVLLEMRAHAGKPDGG